MTPGRVEVTWLDTHGQVGWVEHLNTSPLECRSVGFLAHSSKESIVLSSMYTDGHSVPFGHTVTIPRGCVKSVRRLEQCGGRRKRSRKKRRT